MSLFNFPRVQISIVMLNTKLDDLHHLGEKIDQPADSKDAEVLQNEKSGNIGIDLYSFAKKALETKMKWEN